jgi:hypothetical protein
MEFVAWPKIPSFAGWLKDHSIEELNQPIFCSVKIHGTNAAIGINGKEVWAQSRSRIITPSDDNMGFARWVEGHKEWLLERYEYAGLTDDILIFGEFAGKGIQQKVGVSNLEKFFYIFPNQDFTHACFYNTQKRFYPHMIVKANLDTDENRLITMNDKFNFLRDEIDQKCPFYELLTGLTGVGEGFVVYNDANVPLFKVKGDSHQVKNSSTPRVPVNPALEIAIQNQIAFGTAERLNQVYLSLSGGNRLLELSEIKTFIQAVIADIESEEGELDPKAKKIIGNNAAMFLKSKI